MPIRKWCVTLSQLVSVFVVYVLMSFVIMPRLQMYGHQRQGSDSAAFKELTKKDAQTQLIVELEKLLKTCSEGNREVIRHSIHSLSWFQLFYSCCIVETGHRKGVPGLPQIVCSVPQRSYIFSSVGQDWKTSWWSGNGLTIGFIFWYCVIMTFYSEGMRLLSSPNTTIQSDQKHVG